MTYIAHIGVGHKDGGGSGRYPWGSGDRPYQSEGGINRKRKSSNKILRKVEKLEQRRSKSKDGYYGMESDKLERKQDKLLKSKKYDYNSLTKEDQQTFERNMKLAREGLLDTKSATKRLNDIEKQIVKDAKKSEKESYTKNMAKIQRKINKIINKDNSNNDYSEKLERAWNKLSDNDRKIYNESKAINTKEYNKYLKKEGNKIDIINKLEKSGYDVNVEAQETNLSKVKSALSKLTGMDSEKQYKRVYSVKNRR